ncbi:hypothetical protein [Intrasporangium sp. YIM S08009]|uniref:arsenate reductase/protein-tyrosine-phosphatase family protein n=1 Tax=Intrasporangium zincisolvens TaxID=3080018 RepID=UPI002B051B7A|nr:hypothetical protein [Intrasporangium sp. YIM S08009]
MLGDNPQTRGILFICTGNICRSPYAERRLRQLLPNAGALIQSAGTGAVVGSGIEDATREQLRRLGADVTDFRARQVSPEMVDAAGLVLTMTRAHRGQVARLRPAAMRRIFALGDFADLCAESRTWRSILPTQPWLDQVVTEAAAARGTVVPRDADEIDVVDPFRQSARVHEDALSRIEDQLDVVVTALASVVGSARV